VCGVWCVSRYPSLRYTPHIYTIYIYRERERERERGAGDASGAGVVVGGIIVDIIS
jgi:hypothetical protein